VFVLAGHAWVLLVDYYRWKHSSAAYLNHTLAAVSTSQSEIDLFKASKTRDAMPASPSPAHTGIIHLPLLGLGTLDLPHR